MTVNAKPQVTPHSNRIDDHLSRPIASRRFTCFLVLPHARK